MIMKKTLTADTILSSVEELSELVADAEEYGWTIDNEMFIRGAGVSFDRGISKIWRTLHVWQCADLIDGHFKNHRPYKNIYDAFAKEKIVELLNK
jgi:hypothetical protein